jgi:N-acetylglucosamine-6-phosphate deacetylase
MVNRGSCFLIDGAKICTKNKFIKGGVYIENGIIKEILDRDTLNNYNNSNIEKIELSEHYTLLPGFIDIHVHGLMGVDTMDRVGNSFEKMSTFLPSEGVTSFLATTISSNCETIKNSIMKIKKFMESSSEGANLLGINLEGPFLAREKAGAHKREMLINPNIELFEEWQYLSGNNIKIVTIAPELPGAFAFIKKFKDSVILSMGHTNCTYEIACQAIRAGIKHVTHLFNAMSGIDHRNPGAALAVLNEGENITSEIIVDRFHLNIAIVKFIYNILGKERLILISDSMRAKGLNPGEYEFGGQKIIVDSRTARLADGVLAGSLLKINEAVKNMVDITNDSLINIAFMTSANPAKLLNIDDKKGTIEVGKDADLVVLDNDFNVVMTFCMGKMVYQNKLLLQ